MNSATYAARWGVRLLGIVFALGAIALAGWIIFQPLLERGGWDAVLNSVLFFIWWVVITLFVVTILRGTFKWADNIGEEETDD